MPVQEKFVKIYDVKTSGKKIPLLKNSIDIAHGISIADIMRLMVAAMNTRLLFKFINNDVAMFAYAMFNSKSDQEELCDFFRVLSSLDVDSKKQKNDMLARADSLTEKLNAAPNNLMPGNSSTNKSIHADADPHVLDVIFMGEVLPVAMPSFTSIRQAYLNLARHYKLVTPWEKPFLATQKSSSVSNDKDTAYFDEAEFPTAVKDATGSMIGGVSEVSAAKKQGKDPYAIPAFARSCAIFNETNNPDIHPFIGQYDDTHDDVVGGDCVLAAFQTELELEELYGITPADLPASMRKGILSSAYGETDDDATVESDYDADDERMSKHSSRFFKPASRVEKPKKRDRFTLRFD